MNAPALEKGLDILEVLVAKSEPLTLSQIANRCGRSVSEIQRMVHVLLRRGYLHRTGANAYGPGLKLYELGRFRHPFRHLQQVAEPLMARAANSLGHSIHLSVEEHGQMLILSEILGSGIATVALKVGSRHSLADTLSGRILSLNLETKARAADRRKIERDGYLVTPSHLYTGVQDLGVPVRRSSNSPIEAVLACSWLKQRSDEVTAEEVAATLLDTARAIVAQLG